MCEPFCKESCIIGDMSHCGRTEIEYLGHCEKLFTLRFPQRNQLWNDGKKYVNSRATKAYMLECLNEIGAKKDE